MQQVIEDQCAGFKRKLQKKHFEGVSGKDALKYADRMYREELRTQYQDLTSEQIEMLTSDAALKMNHRLGFLKRNQFER